MIKDYHITALIPARSGSKRLPKKNIKMLGDKPLIAWSIESAKKSKYVDQIIVSTDSVEIKDIAEQYGAQVPFLRPESLSNDYASSYDVIKHAVEQLQLEKSKHLLLLLQPTSPLRSTEQIDDAIELLIARDAKGVVSVSKMEHSPLWANTLPIDGNMSNFLSSEVIGKRSQDLPIYYRLNGSIYLYDVISLLKEGKIFFDKNVYAFDISNDTAIDIDTLLDFRMAEYLLNFRKIP